MFHNDNSYINSWIFRLGIAYMSALLILLKSPVVLVPESLHDQNFAGVLKVGYKNEGDFYYSSKVDVLSCVDLPSTLAS